MTKSKYPIHVFYGALIFGIILMWSGNSILKNGFWYGLVLAAINFVAVAVSTELTRGKISNNQNQ